MTTDNIPFFYFLFFIVSATVAFFLNFFLKKKLENKNFLNLIKLFLLIYGLFLIFRTVERYYSFSSEVIDLSYYHSVLSQLASFKIPRIWDIPGRFVWGDHFEPILIFFVPLFWIFGDPVLLIILQSGLVIFGAVPLFLIAKHKFKNELLATSLCFSYLLFGGLQMGYAYGFHPIVILPAFLFWMYYFFEKNDKKFYLFLFLSLFVKEEVAFIILFFGFYVFLFKNRKRGGIIISLSALIWLFLCFKIIFPYFNKGKGFLHLGQYGGLGSDGVLGIVKSFFTHPGLFLQTLITPSDKIKTIFHTFGSAAFLPIFYPPSLLLLIPSFLEKLLSSNIARLNGFHYSAAVWSVMIIATIESLELVLKKIKYLNVIFWAVLIFSTSLLANSFYGYKPLSFFGREEKVLDTSHRNLLYKIIQSVPSEKSIAAQYQIAAHINKPFSQIHPAPREKEDADYIIMDFKMPIVLTTIEYYKNYVRKLLENKNYQLVLTEDKILVFRKNENN